MNASAAQGFPQRTGSDPRRAILCVVCLFAAVLSAVAEALAEAIAGAVQSGAEAQSAAIDVGGRDYPNRKIVDVMCAIYSR